VRMDCRVLATPPKRDIFLADSFGYEEAPALGPLGSWIAPARSSSPSSSAPTLSPVTAHLSRNRATRLQINAGGIMNLLARLFLVAIALVATAAGYADPRAAAQFTDTETLAALSDSHPVALLPLNKAEPRQVPQYSQLSTAAENGLVFGN